VGIHTKTLLKAWAAATCLSLASAASFGAPAALAAAPSAKDFSRYAALEGVVISPDGLHIAGLVSTDGEERLLAVWETAHPDRQPFIIASRHMRLMSVEFVKNDRLGDRGAADPDRSARTRAISTRSTSPT
jgi:hypothetical protein